MAVLDQQLPFRDAIVLRQAQLFAEQETPQSRDAWTAVLPVIQRSVSDPTFRLWIEPLAAIGADGSTLILSAPEGIRAWAERRYASLIGEALRQVSDFEAVQFVTAGGER